MKQDQLPEDCAQCTHYRVCFDYAEWTECALYKELHKESRGVLGIGIPPWCPLREIKDD